MRPRVFPAEDKGVHEPVPDACQASMRPRVFPAEDILTRTGPAIADRASMRPRVFPAEDGIPGRVSFGFRKLQ